jgi:hypothetical protein
MGKSEIFLMKKEERTGPGTFVAQSARRHATSKANWNSGLEDSTLIFLTVIGF